MSSQRPGVALAVRALRRSKGNARRAAVARAANALRSSGVRVFNLPLGIRLVIYSSTLMLPYGAVRCNHMVRNDTMGTTECGQDLRLPLSLLHFSYDTNWPVDCISL